MQSAFQTFSLIVLLITALNAQNAGIEPVEPVEQPGNMNSKIREYQEAMNIDPTTISSNCTEVKKYYETAIEAYDFLSTFTIETMEETLQNIGKLRTLGLDLDQQAKATFEQLALRDQLDETRNQRRLEELQWRVNWSSSANSSDVPAEEITAMKEEITTISGSKQKELDELIQMKTQEQTKIIEQIQLGEGSFNKLNADKEDVNAAIIVLSDKLESNAQEINQTLQRNSSRGDKLNTLLLQLKFFENEKKSAISFDSIKQLAQLQMKTQDEINQLTSDIESTNNNISLLQESNTQVNDNLITKKAEMKEIELQMDAVNTQLLEIKHQSEEVTTFIQKTKAEQDTLFSQLLQKTSFLQTRQEIKGDSEKELLRAQEKVKEGKEIVERLEREQQMYYQNSMRASQKINEMNQKLLTVLDPTEQQTLEEGLERAKVEQQKAQDNYSQKKEELIKQKQLLLTFENFETSIQNDELKKQQQEIQEQKKEQEAREVIIEQQTEQLTNQLKLKEEQKGEACAFNYTQQENITENITQEEDEAPIIIPTPKEEVIPQQTPQADVPEIPQPEIPEFNAPEIPQPEDPEENETIPIPPGQPGSNETEEEIIVPEIPEIPQPIMDSPQEIIPVPIPVPIEKQIKPTISIEGQKELEIAEQSQKKGKIVNEVKELMRQYEELITIKEQEIEEKLKIVVEKEEIVIKHEAEIHEAQEQIQEQVKQCKQEKRHIITEAKAERENSRQRFEEQEAKRELEKLNIELKEEFKKEGEVFKKKKEIEEKEEKVQEKQAELDKKVEEIEKKIFKDIPTPKKSDIIRVDGGHVPAPKTPYIPVAGSTIPLAYPWEERKFEFKDELITPKAEEEIQKEEIVIKEQEKKAEVEKEVVEEQKEEIKKEEKEVELKEYEIKEKEVQFEEKKVEVQQQITKLDEEIAKCKLVFGQGQEETDEFQMCQSQSSDYEAKKQQLEQMKTQYENELQEFNKQKEAFYTKQTGSFVEVSASIIDKKFSNHLNSLVQLNKRNSKCLKKSIRHKDGMVHLLESADKLSDNLKTVLLGIDSDRDQVKATLKQVLDEINKLYETAIVQRNMKQGQNKLLEQKKALMKLQGACLEAQRILQQ